MPLLSGDAALVTCTTNSRTSTSTAVKACRRRSIASRSTGTTSERDGLLDQIVVAPFATILEAGSYTVSGAVALALLAFLSQVLTSSHNTRFACWLLGEFQDLLPRVAPKALRPQVTADVTRIRAVLGCS